MIRNIPTGRIESIALGRHMNNMGVELADVIVLLQSQNVSDYLQIAVIEGYSL